MMAIRAGEKEGGRQRQGLAEAGNKGYSTSACGSGREEKKTAEGGGGAWGGGERGEGRCAGIGKAEQGKKGAFRGVQENTSSENLGREGRGEHEFIARSAS